MAAQLDILALEPFYGGHRRAMLHTLIRCSRHRWTLLKLPPRRLERRLETASKWFAEQIHRHDVRTIDFVFAGEAMNLSEFFRLVPFLGRKPSLVYFHENQLPDPALDGESPNDLVNLTSAMAASEIWFNSQYHWDVFRARAIALIRRHPELENRSPIADLSAKCRIVRPPVDMSLSRQLVASESIVPERRTIFVDTRDADVRPLAEALGHLRLQGEKFKVSWIGAKPFIPDTVPSEKIADRDDAALMRALHKAGVFVAIRPGMFSDDNAVRAISRDAWPVVHEGCVYSEMIPAPLHPSCLHDGSSESLTSKLLDAFYHDRPDFGVKAQNVLLETFDPVSACRAIDDRISALAATQSARPARV